MAYPKRVGYFTAAAQVTATEQLAINRLNVLAKSAYDVQVRNGAETTDFLETFDYAVGTVPTVYSTVPVLGVDGKIDALRPVAFGLFPTTATLTTGQTLQLRAIKSTGDSIDAVTQTSVTASTAGTTYASATAAKATVSAEGLVTFQAAGGSSVITATHTYASGKTVTATMTVTTA